MKILFFFLLSVFFLFHLNLSFATTESGVLPPEIKDTPSLVLYFYRLGMIIAASLAVLALALGAFSYLISAGKPEKIADAKDRMLKAIIGLVILLSAYLILWVVNPQLLILKTDPLPDIPKPTPFLPQPGVYLYKQSCSDKDFQIVRATENLNEFANSKCIKIINDPTNSIYYSFILHEKENFQGICSIIYYQEQIDIPINFNYSSITVFSWNYDGWQNSNDGVIFYSHPYTDKKGGGSYKIKLKSEYYQANPASFIFDYQGTKIPEEERKAKPNFVQSPGSIKFLSYYAVVLRSSNQTCEIFYKNVENLKLEKIIYSGNLSLIDIIPIK